MFKNMRKRGARICDVAVVVIDLMHGLEQQTEEVSEATYALQA